MNKSAEESMKMPQNFPLNKQNVQINNNYYGQPNNGEEPPFPLMNQQNEIVVNQIQPKIINISNTHFGTKSIPITCNFCQIPITSNVIRSFNLCSCLFSFCTFFIFWFKIQLFRGKELNCYDAQHICPNCGQILGNYSSC